MNLADRIPVLASALWWGSLTAIGFIAVPALFASMPTPADAGKVAARLFQVQCWISVACTMLLLVWIRTWGLYHLLGWVLGGILLALLLQLAVAPRIAARENLQVWHSAGSAMYLVQWACALRILWFFSRPTS